MYWAGVDNLSNATKVSTKLEICEGTHKLLGDDEKNKDEVIDIENSLNFIEFGGRGRL